MAELTSALEAILFASGESISTARLSLVLGTDEEEILRCAAALAEEYEQSGRGIRLLRLDDKLQLCSAPEYAPAYIDQVRGVDSSYTVSTLLDRGLIAVAGRLDAPGRPALLKTTDVFLRTMGISSLDELPRLPDMSGGDGVTELQRRIEELQSSGGAQISLDDLEENDHQSDGE